MGNLCNLHDPQYSVERRTIAQIQNSDREI